MADLVWLKDKFSPSLSEMYGEITRLFTTCRNSSAINEENSSCFSDIYALLNPFGNLFETLTVSICIIGIILQSRHNIWGWLFMAIAAIFMPFILYNNYALGGDSAAWFVMFLWFITSAVWGWGYWIHHRKEHIRRHLGVGYSFREAVKKSHLADLTFSPEYEDDEVRLNVHGLESWQIFIFIPLIAFSTFALGWVLSTLVPAMLSSWGIWGFNPALPYWDALTTSLICFAQLLLIGKYWEAWPAWASVCIMSIGIYAYKGAWPFVIMYCIILVISVASTIIWYKRYHEQKKQRWENIVGM